MLRELERSTPNNFKVVMGTTKHAAYVGIARQLKKIITEEQAVAIAGLYRSPGADIFDTTWIEDLGQHAEGESLGYLFLAYMMHESRPGEVQDYYTS